jgi:hypothetical protein
MARKQSEILSEEQEVLRTEIKLITEKGEEATDDEVARAEALTAEFKEKEVLRQKALKREADVEDVMRAALNPGSREAAAPRRTPELMRKVEAYTPDSYADLKRSLNNGNNFDTSDALSRAKAAVEGMNSLVTDESKHHVTQLLEMENYHSGLVARHVLMCSSEEYQREFRTFVQSQGQNAGDLMRTAMSLTNANGGYLVPVKVAA